MGADSKMRTYQYPVVRSPSSQPQRPQQQPAVRELQVPRHPNDRFSWMDPPPEAHVHGFNSQANRNTTIPPLPQVPDHLHPAIEPERVSMPPTQRTAPVTANDYPEDIKVKPGLHPMYQGNRHGVDIAMYPQTYPHASVPQPEPEPVKAPREPLRTINTRPIAPDANPLTPPTSPTYKSKSRTNTTNLPIIAPPDPMTYGTAHFSQPAHVATGGSWQHDLCSCAEPSTCLTSIFCPCITYGKTQYRLDRRSAKNDPTNMLGYRAVNGPCLMYGILCGCNWILASIQHTRIRKSYEMGPEAGDVGGDCFKGLCCCCCTLAQDEKEMKWREESARKATTGEGLKVQYQTPTRMTFAAPPR